MKHDNANPLRTTLIALLSVVLAFACSYAQDEPGPVNFTYSYATFAGDDGSSVLEIAYGFAENGLTYVDGAGQLLIDLHFYDEIGTSLGNYTSKVDHSLATETPTPSMLAGIERFVLDPGSYSIGLKLVDRGDPSRTDSTGFDLVVRPFKRDALCVSDLELIKEIAPAGEENAKHPLARNGYIIVRNISGLITAPEFRVNSYLEIYNTHRLPGAEYSIAYLIADSTGKGLYRRDTVLPKAVTRTTFDLNSAWINGLPSGMYILAARVFNDVRNVATDSIEVTRAFHVYNPHQDSMYAMRGREIATYVDIIDPLYSGLKEEELDLEFRKASYIIAEHQKSIWEGLEGVESKARFLTRFWMVVDDDPSTPRKSYARSLLRTD